MNRTIKIGFAALALAAVAPAFAQNETNAEGPVGYTPVAIGLATPVQLPWGLNRWDVYGLDLNLFYSDAPTMVGLGIFTAWSVSTSSAFSALAFATLTMLCPRRSSDSKRTS